MPSCKYLWIVLLLLCCATIISCQESFYDDEFNEKDIIIDEEDFDPDSEVKKGSAYETKYKDSEGTGRTSTRESVYSRIYPKPKTISEPPVVQEPPSKPDYTVKPQTLPEEDEHVVTVNEQTGSKRDLTSLIAISATLLCLALVYPMISKWTMKVPLEVTESTFAVESTKSKPADKPITKKATPAVTPPEDEPSKPEVAQPEVHNQNADKKENRHENGVEDPVEKKPTKIEHVDNDEIVEHEKPTERLPSSPTKIHQGSEKSDLPLLVVERTRTDLALSEEITKQFHNDIIVKSSKILMNINAENLTDQEKVHYVQAQLKLVDTVTQQKSHQSTEDHRKETLQIKVFKIDEEELHKLVFLSTIGVLVVWGLALKMVMFQVLREVTDEWWDLGSYLLDAVGLMPPTMSPSGSWGWVSPFERVTDMVWRGSIILALVISSIVLLIILIRSPKLGMLALFSYVMHSHWQSLLRLLLCTMPLYFGQYWAYMYLTTNFPKMTRTRLQIRWLIWILSLAIVVAVGMYAARGDPINPYRKTFWWETYLETSLHNFVDDFFF